jgi:hypothetical protein
MAYILFVSGVALIEFNSILRFFLILAMLPLFFLIDLKNNYEYFYKTFILLSILKAITQIILFLVIFFIDAPIVAIEKILNIDHGMIYHDGFFLHISVRGTVFLVLAFMLRFIRTLKFDVLNLILLSGIMIAGNFAYLLGLFVFIFYYFWVKFLCQKKQWYMYIVLFFFLSLLLFVIVLPYGIKQYEIKRTFSNATRFDQARVLLTTGNVITGNGFGKNIDISTHYRDYTGNKYFELQTLYIINQIGFFGYFIFMFSTIYIFYEHNRKMLPIYMLYLFYSFWNPYCFDTSHMVTVMLLIGNNKYAIVNT